MHPIHMVMRTDCFVHVIRKKLLRSCAWRKSTRYPSRLQHKEHRQLGDLYPMVDGLCLQNNSIRSTVTHHVDAGVILGEYQSLERKDCSFLLIRPLVMNAVLVLLLRATRSGARSFRYGSTRPWIERLEVVFPNGEVLLVDRDTPIPALAECALARARCKNGCRI